MFHTIFLFVVIKNYRVDFALNLRAFWSRVPDLGKGTFDLFWRIFPEVFGRLRLIQGYFRPVQDLSFPCSGVAIIHQKGGEFLYW